MNGFLKRIILSSTAIILAFSLLVSSYGTTQVKAAALPAVYTSWELWVTLLSLLGICAYAEPANEEQAMQDVMNALYEMIKQYNGGQEPSEEELVYFTDLHQYFDASDNTLRIPEAAWDMYKIWGDAITAKPIVTPSSTNSLYGISYVDYEVFLQDFLPVDKTSSVFTKFASNTHTALSSTNYSGLFVKVNSGPLINPSISQFWIYLPMESIFSYSFGLTTNGYMDFMRNKSSFTGYSISQNSSTGTYQYGGNAATFRANYGYEVYAFVVNGLFYAFDGIFQKPTDVLSGIDYGNMVSLSDFAVPSHTISDALSTITQTANDLNIADVFDTGTYEIITPGRTYDPDTETVTGDVVVSLPAPETIQQYSEGTITWQQMLEILNAQAIDTSTAMDLNSQEFINTQKGIANNVANIWSFLQSLLQGLLDMFLSLFIPSEGFFDGKFNELMDMFDGLGVEAYDISNLFDPDEGEPNNPFQDITIVVFNQEVVIVSFAHLPMFLNEFRPVIRGLLMLFLVYYCINQFLSLIRLAGMYDGSNQNSLPGTAIRPADKGGL